MSGEWRRMAPLFVLAIGGFVVLAAGALVLEHTGLMPGGGAELAIAFAPVFWFLLTLGFGPDMMERDTDG